MDTARDTIRISRLETRCIIGTLPREREIPQRLIIDLELACDLAPAGASDALADTVDYAALAQEAVALANNSHCRLLERLAVLLAQHCLRDPRVTAVTVRLEKPEALPGGAVVRVAVTRAREETGAGRAGRPLPAAGGTGVPCGTGVPPVDHGQDARATPAATAECDARATPAAAAGRVHLAGIGGVGMSALAQALLDNGFEVSGSDRLLDSGDATDTLNRLRGQGAALHPQDGSGVAGAARLVVSSAIEADNPDLDAARRAGVPVVHRAAQLAELAAGRRLIAVTGTCGKSTVTAILGWLLQEAGLDPAVVNGAGVVGWDGGGRIASVRRGAGAWLVIEADESDRSLMVFNPEHAIITNASADHFGREETLTLFSRFRERVTGVVIDGAGEAAAPGGARADGWCGHFIFAGTPFTVPLPGRHNIWNAWHAVRLAAALGIPAPALASGLATFRGVERRLQLTGSCAGASVIDDYAHNPEKLAAAWSTLTAAFDRVATVWRPHGYGPLRKMMDDLEAVFARVVRPQDLLLVLPVYDMGGTADRSVNSDTLVARLAARGVPVRGVATLDEAEAALRAVAGLGTALVTCGARDPGLPRLAARLGAA